MRIVSIGGGPAGLSFAILMKKADPAHDVTVIERNRPDETFGFGVVLSDATLGHFTEADPESGAEISRALTHWDDIDIHYQGQVLTSAGHGFSGLSRQELLDILQRRCRQLGVRLQFEREVADPAQLADADLVVAADGVNSALRTRHAERFGPEIDWRSNRFVWLGTTFPFRAFTFFFKASEHGLWRVHAYRYDQRLSTFIVETTPATWVRAGLDAATEDDTVAFTEGLFARELGGHRILKNRSLWRRFPTVRNTRWHWGNIVLVGDAAHTAHFSVGSGTRLAMEDAIALSAALRRSPRVAEALAAYERERRPHVEALQRAAQASLEWFEQTERYVGRLEPLQFAFSLLTRSLRVTYDTLRARDARFVETLERWFADVAAQQSGAAVPVEPAPPPALTPFRLRDLVLSNRLVVSAADPASPAAGDAGLVIAAPSDAGRQPHTTETCEPRRLTAWRRDALHKQPKAAVGLRVAGPRAPGTARMASETGFDLLEIELAHGASLDLVDAVRAVWPAGKPLSARIAMKTPEASVEAARMLKARGCDVISVDRIALSDRIRHEAGVPTMTATPADVNSIVAAGRADLCLLDME
ncbi:MAG TPA: FAD-dependent monooxygenase [Methylomirabilota bacterium]|nr:FAD-dependent monooxygenase [Methylomirabilota bacterium]